MWLIASVAIICCIFVISLMAGFALKQWRHHKAELFLAERMKYDQIFILTPGNKQHPDNGIPCTSNKPVTIQPHFKTLHSMGIAEDEKLNNNARIFSTPTEYQAPLISHYENEMTPRKSRKNKKRNMKQSYGMKSTFMDTPTITISHVPDTNANFEPIQSKGKPELTFSVFYDAPSKDLHITVINAFNLPATKMFGNKTQYFRVCVRVGACSTHYYVTRYVCGTCEPVFCETFIVSGFVHHTLLECTLHFVIREYEEVQHRWTAVGKVSQSLIDLRANSLLRATKTLHIFDMSLGILTRSWGTMQNRISISSFKIRVTAQSYMHIG